MINVQTVAHKAHRQIMDQLHLIFLVLFGPVTFAFCFLTPPMQPNDESTHLMRSVELSGGEIIGQRPPNDQGGGEISSSIVPFLTDPHFSTDYYAPGTKADGGPRALKDLLHDQWSAPNAFASFSYVIYPPSSYLAPSLGLILCRCLHIGVVDSFYIGRLFAGIFGLALGTLALRFLDTGKLFAFCLLCLPEVAFLRGSYSHDAAIIAYAAVAVGLLAKWLEKREQSGRSDSLGRRDMAWLMAGAVLLSFVIAGRPPYFPLAFLFALCVWFAARRQRHAARLALALVALMALYPTVWVVLVHDLRHRNEYGFDNEAQVGFMIHHPGKFVATLFRTLGYALPMGYLMSLVGMMGSNNQLLPFWAYVLAAATMFAALAHDAAFDRRRFPAWVTGTAAAILAGTFVIIHIYAYIFGSANRAEMIGGVWGRYFVPFLLFMSLFLGLRRIPWKSGLGALALVIFCIAGIFVVNVSSVLVVMNDYYYFR